MLLKMLVLSQCYWVDVFQNRNFCWYLASLTMFNSYSEDLISFSLPETCGCQTKNKSKVLKQKWINKKQKEIFENKGPTHSPKFLRAGEVSAN